MRMIPARFSKKTWWTLFHNQISYKLQVRMWTHRNS